MLKKKIVFKELFDPTTLDSYTLEIRLRDKKGQYKLMFMGDIVFVEHTNYFGRPKHQAYRNELLIGREGKYYLKRAIELFSKEFFRKKIVVENK